MCVKKRTMSYLFLGITYTHSTTYKYCFGTEYTIIYYITDICSITMIWFVLGEKQDIYMILLECLQFYKNYYELVAGASNINYIK